MFKWLSDRSLSPEDRVKIACAIYNKNDPSKLYLPKWLSEEIVSLHHTKPRPQLPLTHLWHLLAACLQDGQQTVLNHLPLIHVAKDEITCESTESAINDNIIMCLRKFPDALFRRYDVLIELLAPLIKYGINKISADQMQDPLLDLLLNLLKKFQYCQCNHGNQKKVFKQFCDNLLWPCLQLRCLCAHLETPGDLLASVDKLLASLFHRSHLVGYDSGLASVTASSSYTRHLFESLSVAIANCDGNDEEVVTSSLPHLFRLFLEHNRQANSVVKRSTEFRFFQWLLSQLGISEAQSGVDVAKEVNVIAIHKCLSILQEFGIVEPSHDKSSGGSQLKWLKALARNLVDCKLSNLAPEVINCLSVLFTIYHPIIEPLLPSLLCQPTCLANSNFMMKLIDIYAKLRQLKEFLIMQLESIKLADKLTPTAVYSHPVVVHLANHLRHLTSGQVTEIIEMFCNHLQDNLPSENTSNDSINSGLPKKKKRKLQNKELTLFQTVDLFCIVLDHISLVGVDVSRLIHQQLYHDIILPLLTLLPSLQSYLVQCSLYLTISCTRLLGYTELLTNEMYSLVDIHSACGGTHSFITDGPSLLLLKRLISSLVRFDKVEKDNLPDLLNFIFDAPVVHRSNWDGQWLNVIPANVPVANWRLITSELPYVYSLCSDHHLLPVAGVIIDVFTSSMDQANDGDDNDRLTFVSVTVDFMTSCAFQEMGLLHTLLLQCLFQKVKLSSSKLPKAIKKSLDGLCKMFSKFDGAKMSSYLTAVLSASNNLDDVHQLEIWNESIASIIEILRYLPVGRLSAGHLVMCVTLIVVWLFTVSTSSLAYDQWLKYTLLLAWLLKVIKDHPHRRRHMASFPFLAINEWICSLLLDKDYCIATVWPTCKATLECTASCDPPVISSVIAMCTQQITQHSIDSNTFSVITEIANTSLNAIIKEIKLPLPEALQQDVSQFYHVIQQIIHKACKKKFTTLLSFPSLISLYVTATSSVPEDSVDNAVSSSLLRGAQDVLQDDSLAESHDDPSAISKKYCCVIDILTLALMRGHSVMAVWQTGSQLWQILLSDPSLPADGLPHSKLNCIMGKLVASCSTEDVKIMFESLLSEEEVPSHLLFIKQWQLIVTSKMSNDTRKTFNHYLSRLICKCMEILAVGNGLSELSHSTMSLVIKLLTMCTEHDSRSVMLTLHACLPPQQHQVQQQQHYLKWMGLCIGVLSTILRYHLNTAISCAPVIFTAIGKLMVSIIEVAQCRGASDTLDDIISLAHNLCKVIELVSAEVKLTKFVPHLIAAYLLQAGGEHGGDIPDMVKEILLSGIYLLLRLCTEHETSFLNATLDDCSRELFKSILFDYNKLHKYKGKV